MQVQQLPVADTSPESMIQQQYEENKQQIQQRFKLGWDEINRRSSMLGPFKTQTMLAELHTKAKQEAMSLNQSMQGQLNQLAQVDDLGANGLISNADEVKWRMTLGPEAEKSMFQEPRGIESDYGKLDIHRNRIESRLAQFKDVEPHRIKQASKWWFQEKMAPAHAEVWDTSLVADGQPGAWRRPTHEEQQERVALKSELKSVKERQKLLLQQPDTSNRLRHAALTSKRMMGGGTLGQEMKATIQKKTPQPRVSKPVRFVSPDGSKTYTVPGDRVTEFTRQFPGYKRTK